MTKRALREDNERLYAEINECYDTIRRLGRENRQFRRENAGLRRANIALGEEVNFLCGKIDRAVNYCECKKRERKGPPAWLKELMAE